MNAMNTILAYVQSIFKTFVFLLFVALGITNAFAQTTYPVQIQPFVAYPSIFITDYADPSNTQARILLNDLSKQDYRIKVKIKLEKSGVTLASNNGIEVVVDGGVTYILNEQELSQLFSVNNLSFTGANQGATIPEGVYQLSFMAYDATLNLAVSNGLTDFTMINVVRYDPPLLAQPAKELQMDMRFINQNIFFSWTPRHIVYNPKLSIKYRFRMIEVLPVDRNVYDAMNATNPAVIDQEGLDFPSFIYSPQDLPLKQGSVYAWQVQAYEEQGSEKVSDRFKNLGYSDVFSFSIKEECEPLTINPAQNAGGTILLSWSGISEYTEYEVNYRPKASVQAWIPLLTTANNATLNATQLKANVEYEYTVRPRCKNWQEPQYGGTFTLSAGLCNAPQPIMVQSTGNTMDFTWESIPSASSYEFLFKNRDSQDPYQRIEVTSTELKASLPKLTSGAYTIQVNALCGTSVANGQTYDVAFNENGVVGPCPVPMPFELSATRLTGTQASLTWTSTLGHTSYQLTYWHKDSVALKHSSGWLNVPQWVTTNILDNQLYAYTIEYRCNDKVTTTPQGMFRVVAGSGAVITTPLTADCFPPVTIRAEKRSNTSARVEWDKVSGADEYQLIYKLKNTQQSLVFNTTGTSAILTNLVPNALYQLVVKVRCSGAYSIPSDTSLLNMDLVLSGNCDTLSFVGVRDVTKTNIQLKWKHRVGQTTAYEIKYREEGQSIADEYTLTANYSDLQSNAANLLTGDTLLYTIQNLKAGTIYLIKVRAICGTDQAPFNDPKRVGTLEDPQLAGGCDAIPSCNKNNPALLESLAIGDTIYCADYQVVITDLENTSSSEGIYSGTGSVVLSMPGMEDFVNVNTSFDSIKINAAPDRCVVEGELNIDEINASPLPESVRAQVQEAMAQLQLGIATANDVLAQAQDILNQAAAATQNAIDYFQGGTGVGDVVTGDLGETPVNTNLHDGDTYTVNNGVVTIAGVAIDSLPAMVRDSDGEVFQVNAQGRLTKIGKYIEGFSKTATELAPSEGIVLFSEHTDAQYDFDAWSPDYTNVLQIEREYEKIDNYHVASKFITPGEIDYVKANITGVNANKVFYTNSKGLQYQTAESNTKITLGGGPANDGQYIFAWYVSGQDTLALGKLKLPSYMRQQKQVVLVPVNPGGTVANKTYTTAPFVEALNKTYGRLGITYTVTIDNSFANNTAWNTGNTGAVDIQGSGLLDNDYRGEEKTIIDTYIAHKGGEQNLDANTAYFMLVNLPASKIDLLGKMPMEEQMGFVYTAGANEDLIANRLCHELGHGAYHLEHIFSDIYLDSIFKGRTLNLMDYTSGADELWKFQWDIIHSPGHVWGILKKDKDQEFSNSPIDKLLSWIKLNKSNRNQSAQYIYELYKTISKTYLYNTKYNNENIPFYVTKIPGSNSIINCYSQTTNVFIDVCNSFWFIKFSFANSNTDAIEFKCINYRDYNNLLQKLGFSEGLVTKNYVIAQFNAKLTAAGSNKNELGLVYSEAPEYFLETLSDDLKYNHLKLIASNILLDEFCVNEERAVINILKTISDKVWIYNQLLSNTTLIWKLYDGLDGDNELALLELYRSYCIAKGISVASNNRIIKIGNCNLEYGNNYPCPYAKFILVSGSGQTTDDNIRLSCDLGLPNLSGYHKCATISSFTCNPLDLIHISYQPDNVTDVLPAIYGYHLGIKSNRSEILETINRATTVLGLYSAGRILFSSGAGWALRTLAAIEIGKEVIDAAIQKPNVKALLKTSEQGIWFLSKWPIISIATDLTTLSADLLLDLSAKGPKVVQNLRDAGETEAASKLDDIVQDAKKAVLQGAGSYLENLAKYKQLFKEGKITELFSELKKTTAFPKMGNTRVRNHTDLLAEYKVKYGETASNYPYSTTNPVTDFELSETGYFVRVYSGTSPNSSWIFRIEDLRQYGSVDEIVEKLALPSKPTKIGLVELPDGVKLRKSYAGPQNWSNGTTPQGGGIQYEIIGERQNEWFKPLFDNINEFFK